MLTTLDYLDRVTVTRPGAGTVDPDSGVFSATTETVLDSDCDVQNGRSHLQADDRGGPLLVGHATVWLPDGTDLPDALNVSGIDVTVTTRTGVERTGRLLETDYFECRLLVAWT